MKNSLTPEDIEARIVKQESLKVGEKTTIVILTLDNGFEVVGVSGCVDPANYKHEVGVEVATRRAKDQIWLIEGYSLQKSLFEMKGNSHE